MTDGIEWAWWLENIEVYRDGPEGQFSCDAWVRDDAFHKLGAYTYVGWGDTVTGAIQEAIAAGNARAQEVKGDE